MNRDITELEDNIGYHFKDRHLFRQSLIHTSYANEHRMGKLESNERLEFLGDAVLQIVSSEYLYEHYAEAPEGDLTKIRASLVCEPTLALCAGEIELGEYILLGKGEEATGGRNRNSIVSDAMEALIGALYLDGGIDVATTFIKRFILNDIEHKHLYFDSKSNLQEIVQSMDDVLLTYELTGEEGPDHNKTFSVCAKLNGEVIGCGSGKTKKAAEALAAYNGILKLKKM